MKKFLLIATLFAGAATAAMAQETATAEANFNFAEIGAGLTWEEGENTLYINGETFTENGVTLQAEQMEGAGSWDVIPNIYKHSSGYRVRIYTNSYVTITAPAGSNIESVGLYSDLSLSGSGYTNRATVEGYEGAAATEWPDGLSFSSGYVWTPNEDTNVFTLENNAESGMVAFTYVKVVYSTTQTGINGIDSDLDAPVEYYNLNGVRVSEPADGIFIRRQGSKVSKVVVK